ncbi:MAG: hypothetical protein RIM99_06195 [Cyclobacteriaceae bacterium]
MDTKTIPENYKLKGTAIVNLKNHVIAKVGQEFFNEIVEEVGLKGKNIIVQAAWYPAATFIRMQQLTARKMNMSDRDFGIASAKYVLEEDLNGVYKFFLRVAGIQTILSKLPQMANAYGNFIKMEITKNEKGFLEAGFRVPEMLAEWYFVGSEGAISGILTVCKRPMISIRPIHKEILVESGERIAYWKYELKY